MSLVDSLLKQLYFMELIWIKWIMKFAEISILEKENYFWLNLGIQRRMKSVSGSVKELKSMDQHSGTPSLLVLILWLRSTSKTFVVVVAFGRNKSDVAVRKFGTALEVCNFSSQHLLSLVLSWQWNWMMTSSQNLKLCQRSSWRTIAVRDRF